MRRTLGLVALVAVGALLVWWIEPPTRPTGQQLARGPHVFRTSAKGIRRIDVTVRDRVVVAERTHDGWELGATSVRPAMRDALDDLATHLAGLRAVDAFRTTSFAAFGLDPPGGTVAITTRRGVQRLALGTMNSVASAVYARRDEQARVLQIGAYLVSALDRVLRQAAAPNAPVATVPRSDSPARRRSARTDRALAAPRA